MARFYNPRRENINQPVDTPVGFKGRLEYDPRQDSGSSGGEVSDLTPERQYDVDLRRLDRSARNTAITADTENAQQQSRDSRFLNAARLAGKYQAQADTKYPIIGNTVSRQEASRRGVVLPSLGDAPGARGSVNYPDKPQPRTGRPYNYLNSFG